MKRPIKYSVKKITNVDYADDLYLLSNTISNSTQLSLAAHDVGLLVNPSKTTLIAHKQGSIISISRNPVIQVDYFVYLSSEIVHSEKDAKPLTAKA